MSRILGAVLVGVVSLSTLSGCFLAPAIDSFNKLGVTKNDRMALLPERLKHFHDLLFWGSQDVLAMVTPEARDSVVRSLRAMHDEKVVESKVSNIEFDDAADNATVEMLVKSYKVPYYVVNERTEIQKWTFTISDGWKLASREVRTP